VTTALTGKGAEFLTQLLLVTVVPAALGPGDYGEFSIALAVVMVASASLAMGGPAVMTRFVPAVPADRRDAVARALVARLVRWRALQVGSAAVAAAVLAAAAPDTFPPLVTALVVVALGLSVAATVVFQTALAFGHTALWSFRFPLQNVILAAGAVGLYAVAGTSGAVAAVALAPGVALALGAPRVAPRLRRAGQDAPIPQGAIRFGLLQALSSLLLQLQQRGGVVVVAALAGSRVEAGFASLAIGAALAPTFAVRQAFTVQLPGLVERSVGDPAVDEAGSERLARRLQAVLIPAALVGAIWTDELLSLVVGDGFRDAAPALVPALALLPLAPLTALATQVAALRLRPEARLQATALGAVTFLVVAVAAVPPAGAVGATAALLAGTVVTLVASVVALPGMVSRSLAAISLAAAALVVALGAAT
jgi:O-antigen/teichoic acid export membrane protein